MKMIRFESKAGANITMQEDIALQLIQMMGHSPSVPGAILGEDIAAALQHLKQKLSAYAGDDTDATGQGKAAQPDDDDDKIGLSTRAFPLLRMLEAAERKQADLLWDHFDGAYI